MTSIPVDYRALSPSVVSLPWPLCVLNLVIHIECKLISHLFGLQGCATSIVSQDGEQNGLMGRVDEGVDEFFTKKVTKMDSK